MKLFGSYKREKRDNFKSHHRLLNILCHAIWPQNTLHTRNFITHIFTYIPMHESNRSLLSKELAIQANGIYNFDALGIGAKLDSKTAFQIRSPRGHP